MHNSIPMHALNQKGYLDAGYSDSGKKYTLSLFSLASKKRNYLRYHQRILELFAVPREQACQSFRNIL